MVVKLVVLANVFKLMFSQQFAKEFEEDILVIRQAIKEFGLPENLKLSVHSGSDKFSIY